MSVGYTKLFSEIILSTVWREPNHVRIVWITMLALKDRWHLVGASLPGLADAAKVSVTECEEALRILSSPDKHSRSTEFEGRRIEQCEGGWIVLNGEKYRNKMSLDERREYQRIKQAQYRNRVKSCQQTGQQFTHTDTDTKADTDTKRGRFAPPSVDEITAYCKERNNSVNAQTFHDFYSSKNWMVGKNKMKDWKAAVRTWEARERDTAKPTGKLARAAQALRRSRGSA